MKVSSGFIIRCHSACVFKHFWLFIIKERLFDSLLHKHITFLFRWEKQSWLAQKQSRNSSNCRNGGLRDYPTDIFKKRKKSVAPRHRRMCLRLLYTCGHYAADPLWILEMLNMLNNIVGLLWAVSIFFFFYVHTDQMKWDCGSDLALVFDLHYSIEAFIVVHLLLYSYG